MQRNPGSFKADDKKDVISKTRNICEGKGQTDTQTFPLSTANIMVCRKSTKEKHAIHETCND